MTKKVITAMEPEHYGVQVTEGGVTTSCRVAVPPAVLDDLAMSDLDPARVVEETIDFLLDREPATSLQGEISIDDLQHRYHDFYDELRARVAPR